MSFSDGPRPWPPSRWQLLQARLSKSLPPRWASVPSRPPPCNQTWNWDGSSTVTLPIMPAWLVPQYSVQNMWYVPGVVASNQSSVYRPGIASIFVRNAGKYRLCSTSSELDRKSTRLNSSHSQISYAVFCLKKKKQTSNNSDPCV